jgi:urease accessory protein
MTNRNKGEASMFLTKFSSSMRLAAFFGLVLIGHKLAYGHGNHGGGEFGGGFGTGFLHPIQGLDHVVAMIAVGLWGAQLGAPAIWLLPIAFPLIMAMGAAMGLLGYSLPGVEIGIACSAIVLGLMVLLEARPAIWVSLALVAAFAVFHGHAHGTELPKGESGLAYGIGFVLGTGLLHAAGIGIGCLGGLSWGKPCLRGAGGLVVATGVYFLISSLGWLA